MQPGQHIRRALARQIGEECGAWRLVAEQVNARLVRQPQPFHQAGQIELESRVRQHRALDQPPQLLHRQVRAGCRRRAAFRNDLLDGAVAQSLRQILRLAEQHIAVAPHPPGERRGAHQLQPCDEMPARRLIPGRLQLCAHPAQCRPPVVNPGQIDAHALELRHAGDVFRYRYEKIIPDGHKARRFRPGLVDVPALRHARHHHAMPRIAMHGATMDMAERPIAEAVIEQIRQPARRVIVMTGRTVEAGVHQVDIDRPLHRRPIARQQALRRLPLAKADAMDQHRQGDAVGQAQFTGDARLGIVIAANQIATNACQMQPVKLRRQEQRRLHGCLLAVIQIAGDQQRIDPFLQAQINHRSECLPRRGADQFAQRRVAQSKAAQGGVEMYVGGVNETEGHKAKVKGEWDRKEAPGSATFPARHPARRLLASSRNGED